MFFKLQTQIQTNRQTDKQTNRQTNAIQTNRRNKVLRSPHCGGEDKVLRTPHCITITTISITVSISIAISISNTNSRLMQLVSLSDSLYKRNTNTCNSTPNSNRNALNSPPVLPEIKGP